MPKAKFLCSTPDKHNAYTTSLFYEYRGREYMITRYDNGCSESLREQHRLEQKRIDDLLDTPQKVCKPSGDVERAISDLYALWES